MLRKILSPLSLVVLTTLCIVFGLMGAENSALGDISSAPELEYRWGPSSNGTLPVYYVVQVSVNDGEITTLPSVFEPVTRVQVVYGSEYKIRVAGVDVFDAQGPFSDWSIPFRPEFPPPEF